MDRRPRRIGEPSAADPTFLQCHTTQTSDGAVLVCVHGDLDSLTAPSLGARLHQQLTDPAQRAGVEVALTHVSFVDARGIGTLLAAAHTAHRRDIDLRITGCSPRLLHLFDLVGLRVELAVSGRVSG